MSQLAAIYGTFYQRGYHDKIFPRLSDEEANLHQARHLARMNGCWRELSGIIQALYTLLVSHKFLRK